MLCKRLIASILCRDGMVVQSRQFFHTNIVGNAQTATDFFNMWAIDELIVLDVSRDKSQRHKFLKAVDQLSHNVFVPLAVGGWLESVEEAKELLHLGADKIIINTQAHINRQFISDLAKAMGSQSVVVSIDTKDGTTWIDRGRRNIAAIPQDTAKVVESLGAGEILLRSINHDGMLQGYDLKLIESVAKRVSIPVIAAGGVGKWEHLIDGLNAGADAVSAGNIFHYTEQSTVKAKQYLQEHGIKVRPLGFFKNDNPRKVKYEQYTE